MFYRRRTRALARRNAGDDAMDPLQDYSVAAFLPGRALQIEGILDLFTHRQPHNVADVKTLTRRRQGHGASATGSASSPPALR